MVRRRQVTWADREQRTVHGRTDLLCPICVILSADFAGPSAALNNSSTFSSELNSPLLAPLPLVYFSLINNNLNDRDNVNTNNTNNNNNDNDNDNDNNSGETATCLYNYPHESQMLHRLLPGTMLTLDEQCKRDRGTNACFVSFRAKKDEFEIGALIMQPTDD